MTDGHCECSGASERDIISLVMGSESFGEFSPLLQRGVNIPAMVPCALGDFLQNQLGLDLEYISERITTIFVDGKATDSLDETAVKNRSTIALSAAMPGVVGATFRRGSYYAAMRGAITSTEGESICGCVQGLVCVKLFNLLLTDLGPEFLKKGIILTTSELSDLILHIPGFSLQQCREASINGRDIDPAHLHNIEQLVHKVVKLSVQFI